MCLQDTRGYWTWKTGPGNKGLRSSSVLQATTVLPKYLHVQMLVVSRQRCDVTPSPRVITLILRTTCYICKLRWCYMTICYYLEIFYIFGIIILCDINRFTRACPIFFSHNIISSIIHLAATRSKDDFFYNFFYNLVVLSQYRQISIINNLVNCNS